MKRCPQCDFIYEDDQSLCDMDGKTLVHETRQPDLPQGTTTGTSLPIKKSRLRSVAPVLAGLILAAVLFLIFYASPRLLAKPEDRNLPEKLESSPQPATAAPDNNSSTPSVTTESPTGAATSRPSNPTDENPADEFEVASPGTTETKTNHTTPKTTDSRLTISRRLPPLRRVAPLPRLPATKIEDKNPGSIIAPRKPSIANPNTVRVNETPQSRTQRPVAAIQKKESRVGSFLKKTGRILSKPFKR